MDNGESGGGARQRENRRERKRVVGGGRQARRGWREKGGAGDGEGSGAVVQLAADLSGEVEAEAAALFAGRRAVATRGRRGKRGKREKGGTASDGDSGNDAVRRSAVVSGAGVALCRSGRLQAVAAQRCREGEEEEAVVSGGVREEKVRDRERKRAERHDGEVRAAALVGASCGRVEKKARSARQRDNRRGGVLQRLRDGKERESEGDGRVARR